MKRAASALALVLAGAVLAGCVSHDGDAASAATIQGTACLGAARGHCHIRDGILVVEGLSIRTERSKDVGLRILDASLPIRLKDVDVRGPQVGVRIDSACEACRIDLEGARIEAVMVGLYVGNVTASMGAVHVDASEIRTTGLLHSAAISFQKASRLTLNDTTLSGPGDVPGTAIIAIDHPADVQATGLKVQGYLNGLWGFFSGLDVRSSDFECINDAIFSLTYAPQVTMDHVTVKGCGSTHPECGDTVDASGCGVGIWLAGNVTEHGGSLTMQNMTFQDNTVAVSIGNYTDVLLTDFVVEGGSSGISVSGPGWPVPRAIVRDGRVQGTAFEGMLLAVDRLTMENVSFLDNGHSPPTRPIQFSGRGLEIRSLLPSGDSAKGPRIIRNCSFSGNLALGLLYQETPPLDARNNWWGAATGPSIQPVNGQPIPGFGDAITLPGLILTEPHRTSPP
jgi:hypothetical protein